MSEFVKIGIWVAVIGAVFGFLWWRGYLNRFAAYVAETRGELKKCTWPTVGELKGLTVLISVATLMLGMFTVAVDFVVSRVLLFIT